MKAKCVGCDKIKEVPKKLPEGTRVIRGKGIHYFLCKKCDLGIKKIAKSPAHIRKLKKDVKNYFSRPRKIVR